MSIGQFFLENQDDQFSKEQPVLQSSNICGTETLNVDTTTESSIVIGPSQILPESIITSQGVLTNVAEIHLSQPANNASVESLQSSHTDTS
jgi:hypothetical protein